MATVALVPIIAQPISVLVCISTLLIGYFADSTGQESLGFNFKKYSTNIPGKAERAFSQDEAFGIVINQLGL